MWLWRNDESIRKWMYNSEVISWENHLKFLESLKCCFDKYYWLIYKGIEPIGVLDITNYDIVTDKAEIGYYAKPLSHGVGFEMLRECLHFCFNVINITNLYLTVRKDNCRAVLLDQFFGMIFSSSMDMNIEGKTVSFYVCDSFTKKNFNGKYKLSKADYKQYINQHE